MKTHHELDLFSSWEEALSKHENDALVSVPWGVRYQANAGVRGNCNPYQNLACFVHCFKIIITLLKSISIMKQIV